MRAVVLAVGFLLAAAMPAAAASPTARVAGTGSGQLTTIDVPATAARHLRVALTATATVADVRVYR